MTDDKRMHFIRNIEALESNNEKGKITQEYEVIADAYITGEFTYGPYYFTIWDYGFEEEGERRRLCLRICKSISSPEELPQSAKKSEFYHGGGIADELVALSSLFLRRRLQLGPIVRCNDKPKVLGKNKGLIDKPLIVGQRSLSELPEWLKLVEKLDARYHQRFILAAKLYSQALLLIEEQPDMAYLNLVSAIEALCSSYDTGIKEIASSYPNLAHIITQVEPKEVREKLEKELLNVLYFTKKSFVKFVLDHIEKTFWDESERGPKFARIQPEELENILKRVYDQRSKTLHTGEPFPPFTSYGMGEEIPLGMISGGKRWERQDLVPNPHLFERLVNHVLKTYLKRNSHNNDYLHSG